MLLFAAVAASLAVASAQELTEAQKAALQAASTINETAPQQISKKWSDLWTSSLKSTINFGQTALANWAAGGYNTYSLKGYVDANANYKSEDGLVFWNNRLQLDYGLMYSADKPIIQKSDDRIYLESKWGRKLADKFFFSADFSFKTQFDKGWNYNTPKSDGITEPTTQDWKDARTLKSNFMAPGYINLALGVSWTPNKWLDVNLAPLTGGVVIVQNEQLWKSYNMGEKSCKFELGTQLKANVKLKVNEAFGYTSQLVLFSNYLEDPLNLRVNFDNRIEWKLAKFFVLNVSCNMIYDDDVFIVQAKDKDKYPDGIQRLQLMESLTFGFTYTISSKK